MQVKKDAVVSVLTKLRREQLDLRYEIATRKREMAKLAREQAKAKRELAVLGDLMRLLPDIETKKKK